MRRGLAVLLCAFSLVFAGCGTGTGADLDGEIPIGVTIELTGASSAIGAAHRNSLQLVAAQINTKGVLGKRIKLLIEDNNSNPETSGSQVKRLIERDRVAALIGGGTSATTLPAAELAEKHKVPLISMATPDEIVTPASEHRHVFKTTASSSAVAAALGREFSLTGVRSVGVLAVAGSYGDAGVAALRAGAGVQVQSVERFSAADKDYSVQLNRLVDAGPDAIVVWAEMPAAALAARTVKESRYVDGGGRVYFDPGAGAELFLRGAGAASDNMLVVQPTILVATQLTATTPSVLVQKEFFTKYSQRYGTFSGYASYSADALRLIVAAMEKARSTEPGKVRAALESLSYEGYTGTYAFSRDNHSGVTDGALSVLAVRDGSWFLTQ